MSDTDYLLDDLNGAQRAAVTHFKGPLLILSGAGSGKTRVITRRIAYLIAHYSVEPRSIIGLTFTNKSAEEMAQRVDRLLGDSVDSSGPRLGTFHSLGSRIIRNYIDLLDIKPDSDFTIFDQNDQKKLIKEVLRDLDVSTDDFPPGMVLSFISKAKHDLIDPENFRGEKSGELDDYLLGVVDSVYRNYQQRLEENNALDFGDLIRLATKILVSPSSIVEKWKNEIKFLLVDEYQDTNHGQYVFSQLLLDGHRNICVVGDDDQAIFGWRGADISNILEFEEDFPRAEVLHLQTNYRSTNCILQAANAVIKNNNSRKSKSMKPYREEGKKLTVYCAEDQGKEARFVTRKILKLVSSGVNLGRMGVLYRVNTLTRPLEEALVKENISYEVVRGTRFYERKEIKDLLAYLRVICNPFDNVSLLRIINTPRRGIGSKTVSQLRSTSDEQNVPLWELLHSGAGLVEGILSSRQLSRVRSFVDVMERLRSYKKSNKLSQLVQELVDIIDYFNYLEKRYDAHSAVERKDNVKELIGQIEVVEGEESLKKFLENVALESDIGRFEGESDKVSLLTLHSAKGLEFDHVFIVGFEEGIIPHRRSIEENRLEEERRLCYVGMTRAKDGLYLSYTRERFLYGNKFRNNPSRFLEEIPPEYIESSGSYFQGKGDRGCEKRRTPNLSWRDYLRG